MAKEHIELLERVYKRLIGSDETISFYICLHAETLACTAEEMIAYEDIQNTLNTIFRGIAGYCNWRDHGLYAVTHLYERKSVLPLQTIHAGNVFRREVLDALMADFADERLGCTLAE